MKTILFNCNTGLYYRIGRAFTEECLFRATALEPQQVAFVRATYDGPIGEHVVGSLVEGDLPECGCADCNN